MNFVEALKAMKNGAKVKLPSWGGYWYWDPEKETVMIQCRPQDSDQGELLDIRETQRVEYTLFNVASDEWMIADENNCPVLGGEAAFPFSDAIRYLKRGLKVARKGWNGKGQYIILHDPYDNNEYTLEEKETSAGTMYPYLVIKTNYNAIVPWFPSATDVLAEDWVFVD